MRQPTPQRRRFSMPIDSSAAIGAGLIAGILATVVQGLLWWIFTESILDTLFRDARLTAAILMGRTVLPPPGHFDLGIMIVATGIHFGLSILYSLLLALAIAERSWRMSLLMGAAFGLVLYAINLYGLTALFPWFTAVRDPITLAAHLVFGLTAAGAYRRLVKW
jgi:hypothetical protein